MSCLKVKSGRNKGRCFKNFETVKQGRKTWGYAYFTSPSNAKLIKKSKAEVRE